MAAKETLSIRLDPSFIQELKRLADLHGEKSAELMARRLLLDAIDRVQANAMLDKLHETTELLLGHEGLPEKLDDVRVQTVRLRQALVTTVAYIIRQTQGMSSAEARTTAEKIFTGPTGKE